MNDEQYWRSEQLAEVLHGTFGFHPGWRAVHGEGRHLRGHLHRHAGSQALHPCGPLAGRSDTGDGSLLLRVSRCAEQASGGPVRHGDQVLLPNGQVTDLIGLSSEVFPFPTPEDVLDLLSTVSDPTSDKPVPARVQAWMAEHPASARGLQINQSKPPAASFAQAEFHCITPSGS